MAEDVRGDAQVLEFALPKVMRLLFRHESDEPLANLSLSQMRMMRALQCRDRSAVELSAELGMSQSAISQSLHRLEALELIERRPMEHDARIRQVGLSALGRELMIRRSEVRVSQAEELLTTLDGDLRRQLVDSVRRVSELCTAEGCEPLSLVAELEK